MTRECRLERIKYLERNLVQNEYLTVSEQKEYDKHIKALQQNNSVTIDTEAGFQGENKGDGMSGFRG